jgi:hypothetical protein
VTVVRRLFWVAVGATAAVLVVRRVQRTAEAMTPQALAAAVVGLGEALRAFAEEVRAGMTERELELRVALGLEGDSTLPPDTARHAAEPSPRLTTPDGSRS